MNVIVMHLNGAHASIAPCNLETIFSTFSAGCLQAPIKLAIATVGSSVP